MAIAATNFPLVQPLRFVPIDGEYPADPRDNIKHFDADWFANLVRDWQYKSAYTLPRQFNDKMSMYLYMNSSYGVNVKLIDCNQRVWKSWDIIDFYYDPSAPLYFKVGGTTAQAYAYYLQWRFSDIAGLPEGVYWLYVTSTFKTSGPMGPSTFLHYVSEPISIATKQRGTVHIDYYNTESTQDVVFPILNVRFSDRVYADVQDYSPASTDNQYEDGEYDPQMLASQPYRTAKFVLTRRVPEYVLDRLNRAFGCNRVTIDSKPFTKEIGAKWEINRTARVPKLIAALPIREADNDYGATFVLAPSFDLYQTAGFPYAINKITLTDGSNSVVIYNTTAVIHNSTEENAMIAAINSYVSTLGYNGSLSVAGGIVTWTNSSGDFFISGTADVMVTPLVMTYVTTNIAYPIMVSAPNMVVDYNDGTVRRYNNVGAVTIPQYNYTGGAGTKTVTIYGDYTKISFNDGYLSTAAGKASFMCKEFEIKNSFSITSFDCAVLTQCDFFLETWSIYNCLLLTTLANNTLSIPFVTNVRMNANKFATAQASAVVQQVLASNVASPRGPGVLNVSGQSPAAPMDSAGSSAKLNLQFSYGWTVYTD